MSNPKLVFYAILVHLAALAVANAASVLRPVTLFPAEGTVVGAAFSPDSTRLAVIRRLPVSGTTGNRLIIQIVSLKSGRELAHAGVLEAAAPELVSSTHYIAYSPDGRYLLLATKGSDRLSIIDAVGLETEKRFALHPEAESRRPLEGGHRYFKGVVSLAVASKADTFAVVTHDALQGNEAFVGSFALGTIIRSWSLGPGRVSTQLGQISLALRGDGSRIAVSALPDKNRLPKDFNNLRLYDTRNGEMVKSIRTDGLVGQIALLPGEHVMASRIDTPGFFSRKACIEEWSFIHGTLGSRFCDQGRNVSVALGVSVAANCVVGFASHLRKSIEGQVYAASGRVDVWAMRSGKLVAFSSEIPRLVSFLQISRNGQWIMAGRTLFQLSAAP